MPYEPEDQQPEVLEKDVSRDIRSYLRSGGEADVHFETRGGHPVAVRRSRQPSQECAQSVPAAWDHPHLVKIYSGELSGIRETDDPTFEAEDARQLVMEAVPGGSAAGLLEARGVLPVGEAVTLLVPIAQALAHLHAHGAVHGDVSPQNVMFRADGAPVLIDPGNARALGAAPGTSMTAGFAPVEEESTQSRDVWGWGALAWFVLTGESPGEAKSRIPLPLLVEGIDERFAQLIDDCLAADPGERPEAADIAAEVLAVQEPEPLNIDQAIRAEGRALMLTQHRPAKAASRRRQSRRASKRGRERPRFLLGTLLNSVRVTPQFMIVTVAVLGMLTVASLLLFLSPRSQGEAQASRIDEPTQPTTSVKESGPASPPSSEASRQGKLSEKEVERQLESRIDALNRRDAVALEKVYTERAEGLKSDRTMIENMRSQKHRFSGVEMRLQRVGIRTGQSDAGSATATVELTLTAHTVETESGRVVAREPERTEALEVGFKRVGRSWKIDTISAAAKQKG